MSVGSLNMLSACSAHRVVTSPELYGVEHKCIHKQTYSAYDRLQNEANDTVHILVASHVGLPFLILVEKAERTNARAEKH